MFGSFLNICRKHIKKYEVLLVTLCVLSSLIFSFGYFAYGFAIGMFISIVAIPFNIVKDSKFMAWLQSYFFCVNLWGFLNLMFFL